MEGLKVGDKVTFRPGTALPEDWQLPADAIGTVKARYDSVPGANRTWIDVDFGPELGFLWSVDAANFDVASAPTSD
jgi:hypothetical protein